MTGRVSGLGGGWCHWWKRNTQKVSGLGGQGWKQRKDRVSGLRDPGSPKPLTEKARWEQRKRKSEWPEAPGVLQAQTRKTSKWLEIGAKQDLVPTVGRSLSAG